MHRCIYLPVQHYAGSWSFEPIIQRKVDGVWTDVIQPLAHW